MADKPRGRFNYQNGTWEPVKAKADSDKREPRYGRMWSVPTSTSQVHVTHDTALTYSVVWTCVRLLSEVLGFLPWHVYQHTDDESVKAFHKHPLNRLIHVAPNEEIDANTWRTSAMGHLLCTGNAYSEIERGFTGRPAALHLLTPDRVQVCRSRVRRNGSLFYEVANDRQPNTYLTPKQMFHVKGLSYDGLIGYSVISYGAQSLGVGIAMDQFSGAYFGNGTHIGGILEYEHEMEEQEANNLVQSFRRAYSGTGNAFKVALLENGVKFNPFVIKAEDAQLIESQKRQAIDVCRWFRVPPHLIYEYENVNYNSTYQADKEFVMYSLTPWVSRFESEANMKLLDGGSEAAYYTNMIMNALLRGTPEDRSKFYNTMVQNGIMTRNEIRKREELNPIEHGDVVFIPLNMESIEHAVNRPPEPAPTPPGSPNSPPPLPDFDLPDQQQTPPTAGFFNAKDSKKSIH